MKTDVMPSLVQMDSEELQKLVAEVKETVANVIQLPKAQQKTLTAADLWNLRKRFKSTSDLMNRR